MSPSSGHALHTMRLPSIPTILFFSISFIQFLQPTYCQKQDTLFSDAFFSSRQTFGATPTVGITLLSTSLLSTDSYLINGETEDITYNFVFMPPSGSSPSDYTLSYSCENLLVYSANSCSLFSVEAGINQSDATAYNTTVTCSFSKFPGSTQCTLLASRKSASVIAAAATTTTTTTISITPNTSATPTSSAFNSSAAASSAPNSNVARRWSLHGHAFDSINAVIRQTSYTSEDITCNVYGIVFYLPDSFGEMSESATIVSGTSNVYKLPNYDRSTAGVREILSYGVVPGGASLNGSDGVDMFKKASLSVISRDAIFRYNADTCTITDVQISNGSFNFSDTNTCAAGIAVADENSFPKLGIQFRPYKSGNMTFSMSWPSLGTSQDDYEQVVVFVISEVAPPVITSIVKLPEYRSIPCGKETLKLTGYNMRGATSREVVVANTDGTNTTWAEVSSSFTDDNSTDVSSSVFESAGGSGSNASFLLNSTFGSESYTHVFIDDSLSAILVFSSPPTLASMSPTTSEIGGGDSIVLTGAFTGFGADDFVYVGGHSIAGSAVNLSGTTQIGFYSPARANVGAQYVYDVVVAICAERSNPLSLTYNASPNVTITSADSSANDADAFVVANSGSATFIAEVSGNNEGAMYSWGIFYSNSAQMVLPESSSNETTFTVSSSLLSNESETYQLQVNVTNSLGIVDSAEIFLQVTALGTEYITVNVYAVEHLSRSVDTVTLVQSSVTSSSDSQLKLEWTYGDDSFEVSDSAVFAQSSLNGSTTGPTKLGLEFNIARENLRLGRTILKLTAILVSNPNINASDFITVSVLPSPLKALINGGINGTLVAAGSDIPLSANNSEDLDVLDGDSTANLSYLWMNCTKSLDSSFVERVEDCSSILPSRNSEKDITISGASLIAGLLEDGTNSRPTYFLFGLRVTKDTRSAESYSYFGVRINEDNQAIPELSSIDIVDSKGTILDANELSIFTDIIIRPSSSKANVRWSFDMVEQYQKYLFAQGGVLKIGSGFVSQRGEESRSSLGFSAKSLTAATQYKVLVTTSLQQSRLTADYQVTFRTAEIPKLTCSAPPKQEGFVADTKFTVTATLTFEAQEIEYCFFLISDTNERFSVGLGCSTVPFAFFTFPRQGVYGLECMAKTISGAIIDNVTLESAVVVNNPAPVANGSTISILTERLSNLSAKVKRCESRKDHPCLTSLILVGNDIAVQVEEATASDSSPAAIALLESCKAYIAQLSSLSASLASSTVYRPNQLQESIAQSFSLAHVPGIMIDDETTLYESLRQVDTAVSSTEVNTTDPVQSDEIVEQVTGIANLSLANAYTIGTSGTTRRRLLQDTTAKAAYADLLLRCLTWVAQIRVQQEGCGFEGIQTTAYPEAYNSILKRSTSQYVPLLPSEVNVGVACDGNQVSSKMGEEVQGQLCAEVLSGQTNPRVEIVFIGIPEKNLLETGMITGIELYTTDSMYVAISGIESLPTNCLEVTLQRKSETLISTEYDNLTDAVLNQVTSDTPTGCTPNTCYILDVNTSGVATFTSTEVLISTSRQGLIVAGNITRAVVPQPINIVEGVGLGMNGSVTRVAGLFVVFAAIAGIVTWFAVTGFMIAVPEVDGMGWEYVERDMFGRGTVESSVFAPTSTSSMGGDTPVGSAFTAFSQRKSMEMERKASTGML